MYVQAYTYDGDSKFTVQYGGSGLNSATSFNENLLGINHAISLEKWQKYVHFNQAQSASFVQGVQLTGATSGTIINVGPIVITQGTASSAGMGVMFYQIDPSSPLNASIVSGENLTVSGPTTYCVAASKQSDTPLTPIRAVCITVESNTIRYCIGGPLPTNSVATPASFGIPLTAGQNIVLSGGYTLQTFSMINAVSSSLATVDVTFNF